MFMQGFIYVLGGLQLALGFFQLAEAATVVHEVAGVTMFAGGSICLGIGAVIKLMRTQAENQSETNRCLRELVGETAPAADE